MNTSTEKFWSAREPSTFDQRTIESGRASAIQRMVKLSSTQIKKQDSVTIDLGCGTGLFAKLSDNPNIVGVDFSSTLLQLASERMLTIYKESVFDFQRPSNSVDNIVSLFVIDDYPDDQKISFFNKIFSILKSDGHFFFATYSPNDERMGKLKNSVNLTIDNRFTIYLESLEYYINKLNESGFEIEDSETINTTGIYTQNEKVIELRREFDLIIAKKPKIQNSS